MITYSEKIMKGDHTPWKFADTGDIYFECFPYCREYLVAGSGVSVLAPTPNLPEWTVHVRNAKDGNNIFYKRIADKDEAFELASRLIRKQREIGRQEFEKWIKNKEISE